MSRGDVLTEADLALPTEIGEAILAIINLMTDRLNELAALVGAKEDDDDARQRPTLRKAAGKNQRQGFLRCRCMVESCVFDSGSWICFFFPIHDPPPYYEVIIFNTDEGE